MRLRRLAHSSCGNCISGLRAEGVTQHSKPRFRGNDEPRTNRPGIFSAIFSRPWRDLTYLPYHTQDCVLGYSQQLSAVPSGLCHRRTDRNRTGAHVRQSVPGPNMIFFDCFSYPRPGFQVDKVKTLVGFALFFGPRTLWRTWGTRPVPIGFCSGSKRTTAGVPFTSLRFGPTARRGGRIS